jgi:hypothetical protein
MAFFSGMRIQKLDTESCTVKLNYSWLNTNPFGSLYWAVMGMSAEMSTGALLLAYTFGLKTKVVFILTGSQCDFIKKAKGTTFFYCTDGEKILNAVKSVLDDNVVREVQLHAVAVDEVGNRLAEFTFSWVLKKKEILKK